MDSFVKKYSKNKNFEMKFGKYKGEQLKQVFSIDKSYIAWLIKNIDKDKNEQLIKHINLLVEEDNENKLSEKIK